MKTRYKIILVVVASAAIYILFHSALFNLCMTLVDNGEKCYMLWIYDTSIHITSYNWDDASGIGSWSGTAEKMTEPAFYDDLKMNSGFIFWHMVLPTFAILLIYQKDKSKK